MLGWGQSLQEGLGWKRAAPEQAGGQRSSSKPSQGFFSMNMQGAGIGEGEDLLKLKDNVGTSINGWKRFQIKGGRRKLGGFCAQGGTGTIWVLDEKRGCGLDHLGSKDQAQGSGPLPKSHL